MNGIYRTTQPTLNDGDIEQLQIDESGNLRVAIQSSTAGGDASEAKQDEIIAAIEKANSDWIPDWEDVITSIPSGGLDISTLVPAGFQAFVIEMFPTSSSGNLVYELIGRPGYVVTLPTGPYGGKHGKFLKIHDTTTALPFLLSARAK